MQECTYATTTCTSSAVNHFFVFIWWAILINQIKILLTLHLTQHVCCLPCGWGTKDGAFCLDDFFGFSKAKVVKRREEGTMPRGGLCLWSGCSWLGRAGGEHRRLQALPKGLPWVRASPGHRGGRQRRGGRQHCSGHIGMQLLWRHFALVWKVLDQIMDPVSIILHFAQH